MAGKASRRAAGCAVKVMAPESYQLPPGLPVIVMTRDPEDQTRSQIAALEAMLGKKATAPERKILRAYFEEGTATLRQHFTGALFVDFAELISQPGRIGIIISSLIVGNWNIIAMERAIWPRSPRFSGFMDFRNHHLDLLEGT